MKGESVNKQFFIQFVKRFAVALVLVLAPLAVVAAMLAAAQNVLPHLDGIDDLIAEPLTLILLIVVSSITFGFGLLFLPWILYVTVKVTLAPDEDFAWRTTPLRPRNLNYAILRRRLTKKYMRRRAVESARRTDTAQGVRNLDAYRGDDS